MDSTSNPPPRSSSSTVAGAEPVLRTITLALRVLPYGWVGLDRGGADGEPPAARARSARRVLSATTVTCWVTLRCTAAGRR